MRLLSSSFAAIAVAMLSGGGVAQAAPQHVRLLKPPVTTSARVVRIAAPANRSLTRSKLVTVRVKAGPQIKRVRVFAGTKDVSSRFTRQGRAFTARLPRAQLKTGANKLLVQGFTGSGKSGGAASVSIIVPRSAPGMMSLATGAHAASVAGTDPGYLPSTPGQIPVVINTKRPTYARLTVNGRTVSDLHAGVATQEHHWIVSARDGLKVGRNRFAVESWDKRGNHTSKRWTVKRSAKQPLTDAGPRERVIRPNAWTTIDGSKTRATVKDAKLGYAWRVVKAPEGAKPVLRNATAAKPQFKPDKPGVYQLALRATQTKTGATAGVPSEDVVTDYAVPTLGASGQFIDTAFSFPDVMTIEGNTIFDPNYDGNSVNTFVQLDETTLAVTGQGPYGTIQPRPGTITLGSWGNTDIGLGYTRGSVVWIGTTRVALNGDNQHFDASVGNGAVRLRGWLKPAKPGSGDDATWIDSDMVQVKTRLPSDTMTTNTMQIGDQSLPETLPAGAQGGYQLVILDHNGAPGWNQLYPIYGDDRDTGTENLLAADINGAPSDATFMLQGFGTLPAVDQSSALGLKLQQIGGRTDVVDRFDGTHDATGGVYSLISAASPTANNRWSTYAAEEASFERTKSTGSLTALLVRDANDNDFIPLTGDSATPDPSGSNRYSLLPLAYAPPSSWSNWIRTDQGTLRAPTAAESAAYQDLLTAVTKQKWVPTQKLCPDAPDAIRGYYCTTDASKLQTLLSRIQTLKFNGTTAAGRYTADDWSTVYDTIIYEIGDVSNIRSAIADYQQLFGTATLDGVVDAPTIGDAIKGAINDSVKTPTSSNLMTFLSAMTDMVSVAGDFFGGSMTFLSGAFSLAGADEPSWSPQPMLDQVTTTQDTAASTLAGALQQASGQLSSYGDLLVADPTKLMDGGAYFLNNDPETTDTDSEFVHAAEYATQEWLWGTILAPVYTAWEVEPALGTNPYCADSAATSGGHPWVNLTSTGSWAGSPTNDITGSGSWLLGQDDQTGNYGWAHKSGDDLDQIGLPGSITDKLFGRPVPTTAPPSTSQNAGAIMPYFALNYLKIKPVPTVDPSHWGSSTSYAGCEPTPAPKK